MQFKVGRGLCDGSNWLRNARLISYLHPLSGVCPASITLLFT